MPEYDLAVRGGTITTASDTVVCDVGIRGGRIVALGERPGRGRRGDRRARAAGAAGRHRQPRASRAAERLRHRHGRRLRERHARGGVRRQHAGACRSALQQKGQSLRAGGEGLPRQGRAASATSTSAST